MLSREQIAHAFGTGEVGPDVFDVEALLALADQHAGDVGFEAEVDDLTVHLRCAWRLMSAEQRTAFLASEAVVELVENAFEPWRPPKDMGRVPGWLAKVARNHGTDSGEPDHEVGDLQEFLRQAWSSLSRDQRRAHLFDEQVQEVLEQCGCEPFAHDLDDVELDETKEALACFGLPAGQPHIDLVNLYRLYRPCLDILDSQPDGEQPRHTVPLAERRGG